MGEADPKVPEQVDEVEVEKHVNDQNVLQFLDSMDSYLLLLDSLSSTLRQGWFDLASSRHSMGASRISGALFDLKFHPASTSVQIRENDVDSLLKYPHYTLRKWDTTDGGKSYSGEEKYTSESLVRDSDSSKLRHRGTSQKSDFQEKSTASNGAQLSADNQVQKERSKSLSVFGTLVSPKLRSTQLSFETALETLVEIANMRSSMLAAFDTVQKDLEGTKG